MSGTQTFTYTGSTTTFTVPATGLYDIVATSASGGDGFPGPDGPASGGQGVTDGGEFMLTQNETLQIAVGGAGESGTFFVDSGGGGGSFVIGPGDTPLLIAGGGGGGSVFGDRGDDGGGITTSGGGGGSSGQTNTDTGGAGGGGGGFSGDGSAG